VHLKEVGEREASVHWSRPGDFDCTGEVLGYFMRINSTFLVDPIEINSITRNMTEFLIRGLTPGTQYQVSLASSTRGGIGAENTPIQFVTAGERPPEIDDYEDESFAPDPDVWHSSTGSEATATATQYLIPAKIDHLTVKESTQNSITVEWQLRFYMPRAETALLSNAPVTELIPGVQIRIEWSMYRVGSSKELLGPTATSYTIRNLQSNTSYYIRVIVSINNEDGPAGYTIGTTKPKSFIPS
ncbi:hypothetical protein Ciccas_014287, partial [Cichlidogyrus casuarinus]